MFQWSAVSAKFYPFQWIHLLRQEKGGFASCEQIEVHIVGRIHEVPDGDPLLEMLRALRDHSPPNLHLCFDVPQSNPVHLLAFLANFAHISHLSIDSMDTADIGPLDTDRTVHGVDNLRTLSLYRICEKRAAQAYIELLDILQLSNHAHNIERICLDEPTASFVRKIPEKLTHLVKEIHVCFASGNASLIAMCRFPNLEVVITRQADGFATHFWSDLLELIRKFLDYNISDALKLHYGVFHLSSKFLMELRQYMNLAEKTAEMRSCSRNEMSPFVMEVLARSDGGLSRHKFCSEEDTEFPMILRQLQDATNASVAEVWTDESCGLYAIVLNVERGRKLNLYVRSMASGKCT